MISITPEGVVLKDGEELGCIDGDTMIHHVPVAGVVKGQIRKEAGKPELQFVAEVAEAPKETPVVDIPAPPVFINNPPAIVKHDDIVQLGRPPRPALEWLLERANKGEIPQPPLMGSEGDKTPAFIRWFKQHATPEEFKIQYGGRKYSLDPAPKQSNRLPGEFYES